VSSTSMKVANITEMATIQGLTWRDSLTSPPINHKSFRVHRRHNRHAGPQQMLRILPRLEHDLHRHALDNLHVVPSRVLARQQAEPRAGGRRNAVDVTLELLAAVRIHLDGGPLAGPHGGELRLLEVRGDPDVLEWNERH